MGNGILFKNIFRIMEIIIIQKYKLIFNGLNFGRIIVIRIEGGGPDFV